MSAPIGIAGAGRVAQAMGRLLYERGLPVVCVASRNQAHAEAAAAFIGGATHAVAYADLARHATRILIAVPDSALKHVAELIASAGVRDGIALHTCGTQGADALQALARQGFACGTLHPLQTIASAEQGVRSLKGCAFAVDGDPLAIQWAEEIATGEVVRIPQHLRPLYHAGAVMASNYIAGLIDAAQQLMEMAGIDRDSSLRALTPLMRTTIDNIAERGPVQALTGPIERGDNETIAAHLRAMSDASPEITALYRAAGMLVLQMARRKGLTEASAKEMECQFESQS